MCWVKTDWGMYWKDPFKTAEAEALGEKWAEEALVRLVKAIESGKHLKMPRKRKHSCRSLH